MCFILSSELQRPLNVPLKSGNEVMGTERYHPLHATGSKTPICSLLLSLLVLGMLVAYKCAQSWSHVVP